MSHSAIFLHFRDQAARLLAGDLHRIGMEYTFPLPIHFPDDLTIVFDLEDSSAILAQRQAELRGRGVVALLPTVTAMDLPRSGKFRVWIDWKEMTASGAEIPGSSAIYYCRKVGSGLRTEMIQYTRLSPPGLPPQEERLARTA